jgi:hypothetical protein
MTHRLTFALDAPGVVELSEDASSGPILSGLAVPLGVPSDAAQDGNRWQFDGPPANADELVDAVREHDPDALVGALAAPWETVDAGLAARVTIFDTTRGRDVLEEARRDKRRGFSVGAIVDKFTERAGVRHVAAGDWTAAHLGVVRRPAFAGAGFTVTASAFTGNTNTNTITERTTSMPPTVTEPDVAQLAARVTELEGKTPELPTIAELAAQVAEVLKPKEGTHPLAAFASFEQFMGAFAEAHQRGDVERTAALSVAFAVPDQITTDNPGVIPPGWRTNIAMRLDKRQPMVAAFGRIGLPDSGMDASWPYLDPALNLDAIIAEQLLEKDPLSGVKVKILKGTEPIKTAGAVSDISYQLLMRSSPSYLAAHNEVLLAAWARYRVAKFATRLVTLGVDAGPAATLTATAFRSMLFAQSAAVEDATGAPAEFAFVDTATFNTLGGLDQLVNPAYGTQNVAGTSSARTLTINVNGIEVRRGRFLPAATVIVSNSEAAKAPEAGPFIATNENVQQLGRDVAVWGMYEEAEVYYPAGVRVLAGAS